MLLASWWFRSTVPREAFERRGTRPTWPSHAWLTGSRILVLRGSDGTLTTFGFLGVGECSLDDACVRDPGPCCCQHFRPFGDEGTRLSIAPQGAFARSVSTQSARHAAGAVAQQAPERAAQRCKSGLKPLRSTESLISVSVLCAVERDKLKTCTASHAACNKNRLAMSCKHRNSQCTFLSHTSIQTTREDSCGTFSRVEQPPRNMSLQHQFPHHAHKIHWNMVVLQTTRIW